MSPQGKQGTLLSVLLCSVVRTDRENRLDVKLDDEAISRIERTHRGVDKILETPFNIMHLNTTP